MNEIKFKGNKPIKYSEPFKHNKKFGQNFLSDKNLLNAIVADSGVSKNDEVLEIGTGMGTLTEAIARKARKVVSYEIDKKLTEFLKEKFAKTKNVEIKFIDILKLSMNEIEKDFIGDFYIIANLPFYITTPLIFKFLEQTSKAKNLILMVQKEVAEKIVAVSGNKNYGILSVMINYYCDAKIMRNVKKEMFRPRPKVDSAVIKLIRKPDTFYSPKFTQFVAKCFSMKRKTLMNNLLKNNFKKEDILAAFESLKIPLMSRAENLILNQFRQLFSELAQNRH